ncbi:MAG: formyltetrahydrofolate deformylase [Omnitrophica WOR_2 bacterium RIFCSPLOWO2_12_FULL_50_9]|nr:MAG: formyltetrahydrofolate deformylase [Omnitrophica WOR_2 bacterium RIFCSPHIGHO2_02_FULL_50_17]OGX42742.1 MAG: formyltetrahydrofolate deformylase [Omnitrophica WOR_2 bacterium RIFCSPLOWO2_12_FULL_50_9]
MNHAILLISCPDRKGITAAITNFIYKNNGNIVHADQHIDDQSNTFFMRIEWSLEAFRLYREKIPEGFQPIARRFAMKWDLCFTDQLPRMAVFVSKHLHCLQDLLYRKRAGHFACEIPLIISNHPCAREIAGEFGIKFFEFPMTGANKKEQEKKQIRILKSEHMDLVVLARYHQILTAGFVKAFPHKIINIHHSFLPAFAGKSPYAQAYQKGVKIIGATSHYVTEKLDEGPIIEQDTVRVTHRDSLDDLVRKGEDLERMVLSRAVRWHLERKILCYGNKTVIFD